MYLQELFVTLACVDVRFVKIILVPYVALTAILIDQNAISSGENAKKVEMTSRSGLQFTLYLKYSTKTV